SLIDEAERDALERVYGGTIRDGLTGVLNKKHLEERIDAEIAFASRQSTELSLAILDVDHLRRLNATFRAAARERVLKEVATALSEGLRTEDLLGRYGGEEFVVVVRGLDAHQAVKMAERAREAVSRIAIPFDGKEIRVTVSAGVASLACCSPLERD